MNATFRGPLLVLAVAVVGLGVVWACPCFLTTWARFDPGRLRAWLPEQAPDDDGAGQEREQAGGNRSALVDWAEFGTDSDRIVRTGEVRNTLEIVAPIAGRVIAWDARPGTAVEPTTPLFVIAGTATMWLWIDVGEADSAAVAPGQNVSF